MTLPTYDEAFAKAREGAPFSNGTEGDAWMENNCERCVHDKGLRAGEGSGCPLVMVAYMGKTPIEWLEKNRSSLGDQYHCVYFRDEDDPGPDEPTPIPAPPDQEVLFPRDEYVRPGRMFADTKPVEAEVTA